MTLAKSMADMARGAEAVRVTVRRDGKADSAELEVIGPDGWWVSLLAESVRVEAEGDCAGAVLTFLGGERVTIGAPEEAMRASARCAPAASDGACEEPAPLAARWWQTVGAWGANFALPMVNAYRVEQVEGDRGAWVRTFQGTLFLEAAGLDGMTPIQAPPDRLPAVATAAERERDHYYGLLEASTRTANELHALVGRIKAERDAALKAQGRAEYERIKALFEIREAIGARDGEDTLDAVRAFVRERVAERNAILAELDSLRGVLASLESTFRRWASEERNGAREAFKDPCLKDAEIRQRVAADAWTKAAEEVARVRKAAP